MKDQTICCRLALLAAAVLWTTVGIAEEKSDEIVLRPGRASQPKLSWEATAKAMAAAGEDWSAWDAVAGDGIHGL